MAAMQRRAPAGRARWWPDSLAWTLVALAARLATVVWAWGRFPPAGDGSYYHRLAVRVAEGQGYTWLWPDGAITYASHYPVGYPALLASLYAVAGPSAEVGMLLNALLGALGCLAVHRLLAHLRVRVLASVGAALVALHPGLVAYTPALMTEAVTAALVATAGWAAMAARSVRQPPRRWVALAAVGALIGLATLVRPQCLVLAPLLGLWLGWGSRVRSHQQPHATARRRPGSRRVRCLPLISALWVTVVALGVCAPWTARNCARMGRCALVSVNAGWNLLIGTDPAGRGGWAPLKVPGPCVTEFDEAQKDLCFERAAYERIRSQPWSWLRLAPRKLATTFNYCGAAGWYLHESNRSAFGQDAKVVLGAIETVYERVVLLFALLAVRPRRGTKPAAGAGAPLQRGRTRRALLLLVVGVGALCALLEHAWISHAALAAALALRRPPLARSPAIFAASLAVLLSVGLTHVVFFGAGRYSLVTFPLLCGLAAVGIVRAWPRRRRSPPHERRSTRGTTHARAALGEPFTKRRICALG